MTAALMGADEAEPKASLQDWTAVVAGALGALIASLDISIVNASLPQIQGEIGANGTEGTWISTGYLVSEVVMIPLAAWLTRVLGLRTLLLTCTIAFTAFSMLCGVSDTLALMVVGRVGQGFFGGALIPTAQSIMRTRLPRHQLPIGMTIFGLIVLLGPLVGPVFGGWLTENIGWQWCFFLNLPIAIGLVLLLLLGLPNEKGRLADLKNADWLGIAGLTLCLSSLTVVLESGQRQRWFDSPLISGLTAVCALGFVLLIIGQFRSPRPVIKLSLLLNPSYASVIFIVVVIGMVLYGILYILPQFLSVIAGYNSEASGKILFLSGLPAFMLMPFLPRLLRLNLRLMVLIGLVFFSLSCFLDTSLTADSSGDDFVFSQLLRGFGQIFAFMPLNQASMGAVSREDAPDASGLYNMSRNLGGSLGLALLGIFIDRQVGVHTLTLGEAVDAGSPLVQARMAAQAAAMTGMNGGDASLGQVQSLMALSGAVGRQALIITYGDCFRVLGFALLALVPLILLLRPPPPLLRSAGSGH
jgi:DHA2 family multidrug resistance protein